MFNHLKQLVLPNVIPNSDQRLEFRLFHKAFRPGMGSMTEPDYESYTVEELRDALEHIDRQRFPERLARLQQELNSRQSAKQHTAALTEDDGPFELSRQQLQWLKKSH